MDLRAQPRKMIRCETEKKEGQDSLGAVEPMMMILEQKNIFAILLYPHPI
jgi:hypothetical protein